MSVYINRDIGISLNIDGYRLEIRNGVNAAKVAISRDGDVIAERELDSDDLQAMITALQDIQTLTEGA